MAVVRARYWAGKERCSSTVPLVRLRAQPASDPSSNRIRFHKVSWWVRPGLPASSTFRRPFHPFLPTSSPLVDTPTKPTSGKRAAPSPRRPQPKEKPRYAPPHSTQTIRVAPPRGANKVPLKISTGCDGEEGGDHYRTVRTAGGVVDDDGLVRD